MLQADELRNISLKIQDIEILRGVSILFVVIHHAHGNLLTQAHPWFDSFYSYFGLGVGVDIFFAISGFVITRQLMAKLPENQPWPINMHNVATFWIKRFWRLAPSAWLWLVLILLAAIFFNKSGAFGSVKANYEATIAGVMQVANFRFADTFGRSEYGASFVYWSLSLEEQFYLIFPFLILLSKKRLPWVLAIIAAVQLLHSRDLLGITLRTDGLALGALIALWQGHQSYQLFEPLFLRNAILRWFLFVVLLMFIGSIGAESIRVVPYGFSLIAVLAAILVFFASFDRGYIDVPGPIRGFLVWLGSRSYTLYLIHVPAFFATREIFFLYSPSRVIEGKENWVPLVVVFVVLAVVLVEINYRFIERPCRSYGAKIAKRYGQLRDQGVE